MSQPTKADAIQKHLELKEIKEDVIVLRDGGLRAILMTTNFNFALKSVEEQDAIILRYQDFLNSLDFPVQILINSRKFNIDPYIESLEQKQALQENELLRVQIIEYADFVRSLTESTNIMSESFYVIVPYNPSLIKKTSFWDRISNKPTSNQDKEEEFFEKKNALWQRVEFVSMGLRAIGIKAVPLNSEELVELFYKLYNPGAKEELELIKAKELRLQ